MQSTAFFTSSSVVLRRQLGAQEYFNLDINPIIERAQQLKVVRHVRLGINDFDPFSLRLRLPEVIKEVTALHKEMGGTVYIHCTAGHLSPTSTCCVAVTSAIASKDTCLVRRLFFLLPMLVFLVYLILYPWCLCYYLYLQTSTTV